MTLLEDLIARIDVFLARNGMAATTFGKLACNDPNFVADVREGRDLRMSTIGKVDSFMDSYVPPARDNSGARPDPSRDEAA